MLNCIAVAGDETQRRYAKAVMEHKETVMNTYLVTLGAVGGGSGTFVVIVHALTPDMARHTAMTQYPGCSAQAVKTRR